MNIVCRNRGENKCSVPPRNRKRCFGEWLGEDKETASTLKAVYTIQTRSSSSGSHDVKDCWTGMWHDNGWHVFKSKNCILQVGPKWTEGAEIQALEKDMGGNILCPRSSFMSDCGIIALTPHHVCFSVPAIASDNMPQLAQALWAIRDIIQWCSWLVLTLQFLS